MTVAPAPVVRDGPAVAAPLWQRAQARAAWRPVSGNARRRGVVERRLLERHRGMAGAAVLLELSRVHVGVAVAARLRLETDLCRRLDVTGRTRRGGVDAVQRKRGARMVEVPGLPGIGRVALGAVRPEGLPVRFAVAVGARAGLEAPEDLVDVALRAVDRSVRAGQRETRFRVIELLPRVGKRRGRGVARRTGRPERALVGVLMARHARRARVQEGPGLVTPRTIAGKRGMAAVQREPGFRRMVELLDVERPEIRGESAVFGVAPFAAPGDVAVNALLRRQSARRWACGTPGTSPRRARGPVRGTSDSLRALRVASGPWKADPARRWTRPGHPQAWAWRTRARSRRQPRPREKKDATSDTPCFLTGAQTKRRPEIER